MIEASFDRSSRMSAVSGVYQYDTGQKLRMNGLPSPEEFLAGDTLLSGEIVTVQVHFSHDGDAQSETRLAQWDDECWCWEVDIPDEHLTRIDPVRVYVYVYHGEDGGRSRAHTQYEGVFSPISRPAPDNVASQDMLDSWATLEAEVDLVLTNAQTAIENANTYAEDAQEAAETAQTAAEDATQAEDAASAQTARLDAVEAMWDGMSVQTTDIAVGSDATAAIEGGVLTLGLPRGAKGAKGDTGDTGPADITLAFADGVLTITTT